MNRIGKSLAAIVVVLNLMFSIAYSTTAQSRISPSTNLTPITSQDPDVHTIKDAGLRFELPKAWKAETQANGNIFVSFEDGAASVTFVVEDKYLEVVSGMKSSLKELMTNVKSDGDSKEDTHNGMIHISESGSGLFKGVPVTWGIDVLKAGKNVTILTFGVATIMVAHATEYEKFVNSIKKI